MSIAGKIGSEVLERTVGFGLADDVAEKMLTKGLVKNYLGSGAMVGGKALFDRGAGIDLPMAQRDEINIMGGLDTSNVPGGSVSSGLGLLGPNPALAAAPRSDLLQAATMKMRAAERALEGSPFSLLFPTGLTEYLEAANKRYESPTNMTRVKGLLDVL